MHKKYLEYAGLSEKESEIYLALLKTGAVSPMDLARTTPLKKSIIYLMLESLVKRGLVREVTVGKRVQFEAESPDVLRMVIQDKRNRVEEEAKRLETVISELKSISFPPVVCGILGLNIWIGTHLSFGLFAFLICFGLFWGFGTTLRR